MKYTSNYVVVSVLTCLLALSAVSYFHYRVDRWGVYTSDYQTFQLRISPNLLFLKTRYLLTEDHPHDCFLFGSSRVAAIEARQLPGKCYNFTHNAGLPEDHLHALEKLIDAGVRVERVYVGVDDLAYHSDPDLSNTEYMRRPYPDNVFEWLDFHVFYLQKPIEMKDLNIFTGAQRKRPTPRWILDPDLTTDRIRRKYRPLLDREAEQDLRIRKLEASDEGEVDFGVKGLTALRKIRLLAERHKFDLQLFFVPLHYKTYLSRDYQRFSEFKRGLAAISPYYDFSGLNSASVDNTQWKETIHYSPAVGDRILARLNSDAVHSDNDFGQYINESTFTEAAHLQLVKDVQYLPLVISKEVFLQLPQRFFEYWMETGQLYPENQVLGNKGQREVPAISLKHFVVDSRSSLKERTIRSELNVQMGAYYVVRLEVLSQKESQLRVGVAQDEEQFGLLYKYENISLRKGRNTMLFVGLATVDKPAVVFEVPEGDVDAVFDTKQLFRLNLTAALQSDDAYSGRTDVMTFGATNSLRPTGLVY